jgi:hypothetical protein
VGQNIRWLPSSLNNFLYSESSSLSWGGGSFPSMKAIVDSMKWPWIFFGAGTGVLLGALGADTGRRHFGHLEAECLDPQMHSTNRMFILAMVLR